jgi:hypothetical protein
VPFQTGRSAERPRSSSLKNPLQQKQSKLCSSILVFECVSEIPRVHPVCVFRPLCFFQLLKRYQEGARGHIVHRENLVVESPNKFVTTRGEKKGTNNNREKWAVVKCVVLLFRIFLAPFYVSSEKVKTCRAQSSHEK